MASDYLDIAALVKRIAEDRTIRLVASARLHDRVLLLMSPHVSAQLEAIFTSKIWGESHVFVVILMYSLIKLVENDDLDDLNALQEIEGATSGRLRAQEGGADRLDSRELVHGIPHANFINAAFSYWLPQSLNRFNGPGRGAWYAALDLETSIAEVSFHMERELANISDYSATVDYAEMFASFIGEFVDVREVVPTPQFLQSNPVKSYTIGNLFADAVRAAGHYGIVYPSVRNLGGTCLVALVPHAVQSVRQGRVIRLAWTGRPGPSVWEVA